MEKIAIIDSHHHLWDLNSKETYYPWLSGNEENAFYGSFKSIKKSYLLDDYLNDANNQNLVKSVNCKNLQFIKFQHFICSYQIAR